MSWTESFTNVTPGDVAALKPKNEATLRYVNVDAHGNPTNELQFTAACRAAKELMTSNSVGDYHEGIEFYVGMSGHENEGHVPLPGWSPDGITVSVSRMKVQSKADEAANQEGSPYV